MEMNPLRIDQATGFVESNNRNAFTVEDKTECIRLAQEFVDRGEYPDLNYIMRKLGYNVRTFWRHYDQDEVFKDAYDEIDFQVENILNRNLIANAKKANGVGAAAFWLKNRISKRWSDTPGQNNFSVDLSALKKILGVNQTFIDADATPVQPQPPEIEQK